MQWLRNALAVNENAGATVEQSLPGFVVGSVVEYSSVSQNGWIPAKVVARHDNGMFDLDCKLGVSSEKLRPVQQPGSQTVLEAALEPVHDSGSLVEYYSQSHGRWIPARVLSYDFASMSYKLDCRPAGVPASKVRTASEASRKVAALVEQSNAPAPEAAASVQQSLSGPDTPDSSEPMQLVSVSRSSSSSSWHFSVNESALQLLESYGQRPIALCSVCGPYRSGKSLLLNRLLGHEGSKSKFQVGSTVQACTQGLWLWRDANAQPANSDEPAVLFVDCEGFGSPDSDKTKDAQLMALCMLLSSVFVLNTKGVLSESLFNSLSLVSHFAEHIQMKGHEVSNPGFLWVLRDFVLELHDDAGNQITSDEYLERALLANPLAGADAERSRAAREVRETLLRYFPRRHCATLVQPVIEEDQLTRLDNLPEAALRAEFKSQLSVVRAQIHTLARDCSKSVASQPLGGSSLAVLIRKLVEALNSNHYLNVGPAWESVQHTACAALVEELRGDAHLRLEAISRSLPASDEKLREMLKMERQKSKAEWWKRAVGDMAVRQEYYRDLHDFHMLEGQGLLARNQLLGESQLRVALKEWETWLASDKSGGAGDPEALPHLLQRGMPEKAAAWAACQGLAQARAACERRDETEAAARDQARTGVHEKVVEQPVQQAESFSGRQRKQVPAADSKNCACKVVPLFGFRRRVQSESAQA